MPAKPTNPGTEDHRLPSMPAVSSGQPALVVAFPRPLALTIPTTKEPLGRDWLAAEGVADGEVSGNHFLLSRPGGVLHLEDAGSRNGTWLDGRRLGRGERVALADGALVRVGQTILVHRASFRGSLTPSPPLGGLHGPFGLRAAAATMASWSRRPPTNVLVAGETGTGKEAASLAVAHALLGPKAKLGTLNMAAVPANLFEAQLFGHVAGAFSGADRASPGVFVENDGGAVLLDEIGELSAPAQAALLRVLESPDLTRELQPVGSPRPVKAKVLVIAATNRPLEDMVAAGTFRADLLERLQKARIDLPPLRERPEDLFAIAEALFARRGERLVADEVEVEAIERLMLEPWPTNVRELDRVLDRVVAADPAPGLHLWSVESVLGRTSSSPRPGQLTAELVDAALDACGGNETQAARRLGVTRGKLRRFLEGRSGS